MKHTLHLRRGPLYLPVAALILIALGAAWQAGALGAQASFAHPSFQRVWERTDALVAQGAVSRTWLWGPAPGVSNREPWAASPGGVRLVQYFDKGRMEINDPAGNPTDPFFVTNGLLATELISGQVQLGPEQFTPRDPAGIPVAGDRDDQNAPTYASFTGVASFPGADRRSPDQTGQPVNQAIARNGAVSPLPPDRSDYGVRGAYYEEQTGHNVPDVFWTFLNGPGTVLEDGQVGPRRLFDPWYGLVGLPISEAYWANVKIAGGYADVLIQPFQRRVLTYAPNNPEGFKVEMGNIGLHYLEWRYGASGGGGSPAPPGPAPPAPLPPPPDVRIQGIANQKVGLNLNAQTVTLANASGRVVDMTNWRLVAPKNDHDEIYVFPRFTLAVGATVTAYAGWGNASATQLYMSRITWFFDGTPNDGVLLLDQAGQEAARYFLAAGVPPTPLPGTTPPPAATQPVPTVTPASQATAVAGTPTPTATLPNPQTTGQATTTATPTGTPGTVTATPTVTPGGGVPTGTPTPRVFSDGTSITAWVDEPNPAVGDSVDLVVVVEQNGQPVVNARMAANWLYPSGPAPCPPTVTDNDGFAFCTQVIPPDARDEIVLIAIQVQRNPPTTTYNTSVGIEVQP